MSTPDLSRVTWRKSTRSTDVRNCVEVADLAHGVRAVRDSKDPEGPALIVTPDQWTAFTTTIRTGSLD